MQHPGGVLLALLLLAGLSLTEAVEVEVHDKDSKTCIYAVLSVNFTILYEGNGTTENATFPLPNSVSSNGSICGGNNSAPLLKMGFGTGHSLSLNFSHSTGEFRGDVLIFTYNTSDAKRFPGAKNKSVKHVAVNSLMDSTPLHTIYTCRSVKAIASEAVVMVFWNVSIQAFVENGTIGKNESFCKADLPTTVAPITTRTTPIVPTPVPTKPPPELPAVGNYTIKNGSDPCLLASMGLQLNITYTENKTHSVNIDSNSTASGQCGDKDATLVLEDMDTTIQFHFIVDQSKFFLKEVKANVSLVINGSRTALNSNNSNLRFWQAFVGSSYMCHKEQSIVVTDQLVINAFNVWVQPFQVKNGTFSRAEDCKTNENYIVPIVVGAVLGAIILIVLVIYIIGRRQNRSGAYE
ncbi:lysosome-associated membrane glycoprotein 2-like isoform X2 [Scyliorhinus torazame]|uniref:lysosome-associated membrane glycoprotein 2-like isoform X2 n=1 Tax=Scyliorhinus torazame TaxID=75743 RepID=UPI003B5BACBD